MTVATVEEYSRTNLNDLLQETLVASSSRQGSHLGAHHSLLASSRGPPLPLLQAPARVGRALHRTEDELKKMCGVLPGASSKGRGNLPGGRIMHAWLIISTELSQTASQSPYILPSHRDHRRDASADRRVPRRCATCE